MNKKVIWQLLALTLLVIGLAACTVAPSPNDNDTHEHEEDEHGHDEDEHDHEEGAESEAVEPLTLPAITPAELNGRKLQVVATTSLIGDVVAQVGGGQIDLTVLMTAGQDPHSYEPTPADLTKVASADLIFVNGWGLEEGLLDNLETIGEKGVIVPVSAGIRPLALAEDDGHNHGGVDPHVWWSIHNVEDWVQNIQTVLETADPANQASYASQAEVYKTQLATLDDEIHTILEEVPAEKRQLVTNHNTLGYFAYEYSYKIIGTVFSASSTVAEPSAQELTTLVKTMSETQSCVLFTENTVSDELAQTVKAELNHCAEVTLVTLYSDALGPAGSGAESYLGYMKTNATLIANALKGQ